MTISQRERIQRTVWDTIQQVPEEMKKRDQWLVWRNEPEEGRPKPVKKPYDAKNPTAKASVSDPAMWSNFDTAVRVGMENGFDGVGFVLTTDDPFGLVDFDDCINEAGQVSERVAGWINRMKSFTEVSFSGLGLHVITSAAPLERGANRGWVEMYTQGRYVALTGVRVPGTPEDVNDGSTAFAELHEQANRPTTKAVVDKSNVETIYLPGEESRICDSASSLFRIMTDCGDRFLSSGKVARIGYDGVIELLNEQSFRSDAEHYGKLLTPRRAPKLGLVYAEKPMTADIAKALLAADERHALPPLSLLTELPVLVEADGAVVVTGQGYNPDRGGIYVKRQGGLDPDNLDFDEALKRLRSLLVDFDFVSAGDYARAFAGFITPALRMGGWLGVEPVPVFVGEANESQTGKGYLQDLTAAIYGEELHQITKKKGGVGSLDESIASALVSGRPLLQIDNVRGKVDSQLFEMCLTAKGKIPARIPYSGDIQINPTDRVWFITSNGMETTPDLANRSCIIRLRKRPQDHLFTTFSEGAVLDHVKTNPGRYLEAVFRVVAQWTVEGKPRMPDTPHDFRVWARTLDWITDYCLDARLMEGHRAVQNRVVDPALTMLREIGLRLADDERLGEQLKAHDLGEICDDYEIEIPGLRDGAPDGEAAKQIGRRLARVFKKEQDVQVDEFTIRREISKVVGGNGRDLKEYIFTTDT